MNAFIVTLASYIWVRGLVRGDLRRPVGPGPARMRCAFIAIERLLGMPLHRLDLDPRASSSSRSSWPRRRSAGI